MENKLNLGCGKDYKEGWVNLDIQKSVKADVYHNIEMGLPFDDNTFDRVFARCVLEHVSNPLKVMEEIWRVLKPSGVLEFNLPFVGSLDSYQFHHKSFFTPRSFDILLCDNITKHKYDFETYATFKKKYIKVRVTFLHLWLPEFFQYISLFFNILNSFKGELVAIKEVPKKEEKGIK